MRAEDVIGELWVFQTSGGIISVVQASTEKKAKAAYVRINRDAGDDDITIEDADEELLGAVDAFITRDD